jgi:hypothetical protein
VGVKAGTSVDQGIRPARGSPVGAIVRVFDPGAVEVLAFQGRGKGSDQAAPASAFAGGPGGGREDDRGSAVGGGGGTSASRPCTGRARTSWA